MQKNALAARAPSRTPLGELMMLPQIISRLGREHLLPNLYPSILAPFGAELLCPPTIKSWLGYTPAGRHH